MELRDRSTDGQVPDDLKAGSVLPCPHSHAGLSVTITYSQASIGCLHSELELDFSVLSVHRCI